MNNTNKLPVLDTRIPQWQRSALEPRDCPICEQESDDIACERPDGLKVKKCPNCHCYYISPAPSAPELDRFYSTYHLTHFISSHSSAQQLLRILSNSNPFEDIRIQSLSSHTGIEGARILDVGCGRGEFLFLLKKLGADVTGVELDNDAVKTANALGIDAVHNAHLEDIEFDDKFDVVVLKDIIEHPLRPVDMISNVRRILKDGGLVLIWTPSGNAPDTDKDKITFRVDLEHMQYLSTRSVQLVSEKMSWDILHLETLGFPNLDGLSAPPGQPSLSLRSVATRLLRYIPGFSRMRNIRNSLFINNRLRSGNYHLFAILKKRTA